MDPTTTLVTFMLQTEPSVKSVRLVGSWDNFSSSYAMERDSRRDRGQWKGCYSFNNITCDDDSGVGPAREGGLKMGNTYHYFYELDGSHETHDPSRPTTRHCPYMPGQTVNTLSVPIQQTLRKRSASLSSMRNADFMTMNPRDKYTTPRAPAPRAPLPSLPSSAHHLLRHRSSSRSLSPSPSWRRFFRRSPERGRAPTPEVEVAAPPPAEDDARSVRSCASGSRSRDISPESLSRFLRDEVPEVEERPVTAIPEECEEEEEAEADDDENFASAGQEGLYPTGLAPPPFKRTVSPAPSPLSGSEVAESPILPDFERRSRFSFSSVSSCASSVASPDETPVVYGLAEERDSGYGLPGTASSKSVGPVGVEDLGWMVDVIKS